MQPDWQHVDSTNVKAIAFHGGEASGDLFVEFANGGLYKYSGVERSHYVDLAHAESVGKYLNQVIKVMYPYEKIDSHEALEQQIKAA